MASNSDGDQNIRVPVNLLGVVALVAAILALVFSFLAFTDSGSAKSLVNPTADPGGYTKVLVEEAIEHYRAEGREATVEHYNSL